MKLPTMFDWYQEKTQETAIYGNAIRKLTSSLSATVDNIDALSTVNRLLRIAYVGMGLGEVGEIQNKLKKIIRDNDGVITEQVKDAIKGEIGGALWYLSQLCNELEIKLGDCAEYNIEQLASRKKRNVLQGSGDNR